MAVLCGWASIDERGKIRGGKAGDQTGKEVKTGNWYYFHQTHCLRWKDEEKAKKYAEVIKALCNNKHIGYDQNQRTSLFNELKRLDWDYTKLKKDVECDCSELIACGVNCVLKKAVIPSYVYTGNLSSILVNSGYFKKLTGSKYCHIESYLKIGDVLNAPNHHVISVLQNGTKHNATSNSKVAEPTLHKGMSGSEVMKLQANLNDLGFRDAHGDKLLLDGEFGTCTKEALKKFQRKCKIEADGVYGEISYIEMKALIGNSK